MPKKSSDTISAMLSSAPSLVAVPDPIEIASSRGRHPSATIPDDAPYDDDLGKFELVVDKPLVRPRRRREPKYQTIRVHDSTSTITRQAWIAAKREDPLLSYTDFATLVVQAGLRALKDQTERGE